MRFEGGRNILSLTVDADGRPDLRAIAAGLPAALEIEVRYSEVNPFAPRAKRRIHAADREPRP